MAFVLTTASAVTCPTQGRVATSGRPKLKVNGSPVLRLDGINGKPVIDCGTKDQTGPPPTEQCRAVASAAGAAAKLRVDGQGVALDTLTGTTNGKLAPDPRTQSTTPALSATAGQSKLKAV